MGKTAIHLADDTSILLDGSAKIITIKSLYFEILGIIFLDIHYYKTQVVLIRYKTHCDTIIRTNKAQEWEKEKK